VVIVNVGHIPGSDALERVVTATLHSEFPYLVRDLVSQDNSLVVGSTRPLAPARLLSARAGMPRQLAALAGTVYERLAAPLRGGAVYTDDRAPVEWLTDLSIVRYAAQPGAGRLP
jgi:hypothetical protein